jgi:hypothetical protein
MTAERNLQLVFFQEELFEMLIKSAIEMKSLSLNIAAKSQ